MILRGAFRSCDHPVITRTESFADNRSPIPVVPGFGTVIRRANDDLGTRGHSGQCVRSRDHDQ